MTEAKYKVIPTPRLDGKNSKDWNTILVSSNEATIYHSLEWNAIQHEYGGLGYHAVIAYLDTKPVGLFPLFVRHKNRLISHALNAPLETPYGGPVTVSDISAKDRIKLTQGMVRTMMGSVGSRTISFNTTLGFDPLGLEGLGLAISKKQSSVLDLEPGEKQLFAQMRRNHRRQLKKAESHNYSVIHDETFQHFNDYYDILKATYSRLGNENLVAEGFYTLCIKRLPPGSIKLFMVRDGDEFIAGGLVLIQGDTITFWRGATLDEYMSRGVSNLLYWSIITWAVEEGHQTLDTLHNPSESLYHFKLGFGCELKTSHAVSWSSRGWKKLKRIQALVRPKVQR